MAPALLVLAGLSIYPTIYSLVTSLVRWNLLDPSGQRFIGVANYTGLLSDPAFWNSVRVTVVFVAAGVGFEFVLAFGLALVFFRGLPGERIMRGIIMLPMLAAPVVVGLLARFMLNQQFGIVNQLLSRVGVGGQDFLGSLSLTLPTLIVIDIWQWTPFLFLILLAGMQGLPEDIIEAAKLDGATWPRIIWHHFLPLLKYPILVGLCLRVIDAFRVYDIIYMTTRGGPVDVTNTLSWSLYDVGFRSFNISDAAAGSWLLLILVVIATTVLLRPIARHELGG
jgi:multiple sugar transport system permease protein